MEQGEETTTSDEPDAPDMIDEVEAIIKEAAAGQTVTLIRIEVGMDISVSKVEIAKALHKRFPQASVEMKESKATDSIVVKDIEVE